jgi:hypothetical protein
MAQAEAVHYRYYPVHDIWLGVGWDSAPVGTQLQTLCAYFGLEGVATAPPVCHMRLTFRTQARPLALPRQACCVARQHGLHIWHADPQLYVQDGACVVRLDPASRTGLGTLPPLQGQAPPAPRMDLLLYSVLLLLRYQGFYPEHAACAAHDGVGCLLVGASGSGKSTLTLSLVQHGWHYLADDALLLRGGRDAVEAMPLRRDLCLAPAAIRAFPDTVAHWQPCPLAGNAKRRLDVQALYPAQVRATCVPHLLLFPTIVSAPQSQLVPVGKAEALFRLIQHSALVTVEPRMARSHVAILTRLVHQTRCYALQAGRDLAREPGLITALLVDIMPPPQHTHKEETYGTSPSAAALRGSVEAGGQTHLRVDQPL